MKKLLLIITIILNLNILYAGSCSSDLDGILDDLETKTETLEQTINTDAKSLCGNVVYDQYGDGKTFVDTINIESIGKVKLYIYLDGREYFFYGIENKKTYNCDMHFAGGDFLKIYKKSIPEPDTCKNSNKKECYEKLADMYTHLDTIYTLRKNKDGIKELNISTDEYFDNNTYEHSVFSVRQNKNGEWVSIEIFDNKGNLYIPKLDDNGSWVSVLVAQNVRSYKDWYKLYEPLKNKNGHWVSILTEDYYYKYDQDKKYVPKLDNNGSWVSVLVQENYDGNYREYEPKQTKDGHWISVLVLSKGFIPKTNRKGIYEYEAVYTNSKGWQSKLKYEIIYDTNYKNYGDFKKLTYHYNDKIDAKVEYFEDNDKKLETIIYCSGEFFYNNENIEEHKTLLPILEQNFDTDGNITSQTYFKDYVYKNNKFYPKIKIEQKRNKYTQYFNIKPGVYVVYEDINKTREIDLSDPLLNYVDNLYIFATQSNEENKYEVKLQKSSNGKTYVLITRKIEKPYGNSESYGYICEQKENRDGSLVSVLTHKIEHYHGSKFIEFFYESKQNRDGFWISVLTHKIWYDNDFKSEESLYESKQNSNGIWVGVVYKSIGYNDDGSWMYTNIYDAKQNRDGTWTSVLYKEKDSYSTYYYRAYTDNNGVWHSQLDHQCSGKGCSD